MIATLGHNCLIDLEEERPSAPAVRELVKRHRSASAIVRLVAVGASERLRSGKLRELFSKFEERLARLGVDDFPVLKPLGIYGVTFFEHCLWPDDAMESLRAGIHSILFPPTIELEPDEMCDVLSLRCHIYY